MRTICAALAVAGFLVAPPASAGPSIPGPEGVLCDVGATADPHPEPWDDTVTGAISAGPLLWDRPHVVHCTVQVDGGLHDDQDAVVAEFPADANFVAGGFEPVWYYAWAGYQTYLCTSVTYGSSSAIYWVPGNGDDEGRWATDASSPCRALPHASTAEAFDYVPGVEPRTVTIVGDGAGTTSFTAPPEFVCVPWEVVQYFEVLCSRLGRDVTLNTAARGSRCAWIDVDVVAEGGSGTVSGRSDCDDAAGPTVTVGAPGWGSTEGPVGGSLPWRCMAWEEGTPRPWSVTCRLWYG